MPRPEELRHDASKIGAAYLLPHVGGKLLDDVVDVVGHRREGGVGIPKNHVVGPNDADGRQQRRALVGQRVAPQSGRLPAGQFGRRAWHPGDERALVELRPIMAGSAPAPCARHKRTPGRRFSAPLVISSAAAMPVSMNKTQLNEVRGSGNSTTYC